MTPPEHPRTTARATDEPAGTTDADTPPIPWPLLLRAELSRATAPGTVRALLCALPILIVAFGISKILGHDTDLAAAWREADAAYRRYAEQAAAHLRPVSAEMSARAFFDDPRYFMAKASFVDLRGVMSALGAGAVAFGIVSGGADWSTRVMLPLAAAEPRRARFFATRGMLVATLSAAAAGLCGLLLVPFLIAAAEINGTMEGTDAHFWRVLGIILIRGLFYIAIMALIGYALAMLTRRTSTALGIAFAYFVLGERLFREYASGIFEYHLSGLTFAIFNERPMIQSVDKTECLNEAACVAMREGLDATHGFLGLLAYLLPVLAAAAWRYLRTDID